MDLIDIFGVYDTINSEIFKYQIVKYIYMSGEHPLRLLSIVVLQNPNFSKSLHIYFNIKYNALDLILLYIFLLKYMIFLSSFLPFHCIQVKFFSSKGL
jgi:hypothetical protein